MNSRLRIVAVFLIVLALDWPKNTQSMSLYNPSLSYGQINPLSAVFGSASPLSNIYSSNMGGLNSALLNNGGMDLAKLLSADGVVKKPAHANPALQYNPKFSGKLGGELREQFFADMNQFEQMVHLSNRRRQGFKRNFYLQETDNYDEDENNAYDDSEENYNHRNNQMRNQQQEQSSRKLSNKQYHKQSKNHRQRMQHEDEYEDEE